MSKVVGIDFGTSTSEAALLLEGHPVVVNNSLGQKITPSVVGIAEDGSLLVGQDARDQLLLRPEETVMEIKRLMGSSEAVLLGGEEKTPPEIAACVISYLKECAQKHQGETIDRAVITVPAFFTDEQRQATVQAGKLAGFKVERIINEPTAAALAYGIDYLEDNQHILVYDLGGGTLDVTVLEMFQGVLEVKASSGNNQLGGKDFDQRLMDYLLEKFYREQKIDLSQDKRALARIKDAVEQCKIALSHEEEYRVVLPFIVQQRGRPLALDEEITREQFEGMIGELVESTSKPIRMALEDAELNPKDIDLILAVGGSTRIPLVQRFLEKELGQFPQTPVDPELAVVMGAAIQGGIINQELSAEKDILITDVCPYTLGIEVVGFISGFPMGDIFSVVIPRNTTIPVTREETYYTVHDNQEQVEIMVYQGDHQKASLNNLLGNFVLEGVPPAPASEERIKVNFSYDINGILQVEGIIASTGEKVGITIETAGVKMEKEVEDLSGWLEAPGAKKYRGLIRRAEQYLDQGIVNSPLHAELEALVEGLKKTLIQGQKKEKLQELEDELAEMLYFLEQDLEDQDDLEDLEELEWPEEPGKKQEDQ